MTNDNPELEEVDCIKVHPYSVTYQTIRFCKVLFCCLRCRKQWIANDPTATAKTTPPAESVREDEGYE